MKSIQTVLREADRERLLDSHAYDILYDMQLLLELKDRTITEIQEACRTQMSAFIEHLLSLQGCLCGQLEIGDICRSVQVQQILPLAGTQPNSGEPR